MIAVVPRRVGPGLDPAPAGSLVRSVAAMKGTVLAHLRTAVLAAAAMAAFGLTAAPTPAPAGPVPAIASQPAPPAPQGELAPAIALSFRAEHLKTAFKSGNPAAIQAAVQEVELLRRTYGTLDVLPLVESMAIFARELGNQGQADLGLQVVQAMDAWAPNDPTLLATDVILMRQQGLHGYLWSIPEVLELTRIRLTHPIHRWLWVVQHMAWLRLLATLLLWGWAITMALRYRRVFRYLWEEPLLRRGLNNHVAALAGAFLVTFPVVLGGDPSIVAMLWLWMLAPFLLPMEVRFTLAVLLLQLLHPALALMEPLASVQPSPSIVTLQLRPRAKPMDPRILAALPPGDQDFLKGWRQLESQDWVQAENTFRALTTSHPDRGAVWNNLGVAMFQQENVSGAKTCFEEAATSLPGNPEILLNQSVVAFKTMDSTLGTAKQGEASQAAPEDFRQMLAANHAKLEQRTFPLPLADTPLRIAACSAAAIQDAPPAGTGMKNLALLFSLVLPLAAFAAILHRVRSSVNQAHPSQCTRCGDPFHTTDSPDTQVCSKCHHLFILKDGLHAETRKRKVDDVASFQRSQRWLHQLLTVILPGADVCFLGDTSVGGVEFGFFCFALAMVLATGRSVRYPGEILPDPASTWLPLGLALLAVLFFRSWLKLLPRRY